VVLPEIQRRFEQVVQTYLDQTGVGTNSMLVRVALILTRMPAESGKRLVLLMLRKMVASGLSEAQFSPPLAKALLESGLAGVETAVSDLLGDTFVTIVRETRSLAALPARFLPISSRRLGSAFPSVE